MVHFLSQFVRCLSPSFKTLSLLHLHTSLDVSLLLCFAVFLLSQFLVLLRSLCCQVPFQFVGRLCSGCLPWVHLHSCLCSVCDCRCLLCLLLSPVFSLLCLVCLLSSRLCLCCMSPAHCAWRVRLALPAMSAIAVGATHVFVGEESDAWPMRALFDSSNL